MSSRAFWVVAVIAVIGAACAPAVDESAPSTTAAGPPPTTEIVTTTSTTAPTTTTTDPAGEFLEAIERAPSVTAFTPIGFREWQLVDGSWSGGPLVEFEDGPYDFVPDGAATPIGVVYASPDGIRLVSEDGATTTVDAEPPLFDVVTVDGSAMAIVESDGVAAVDVRSGAIEPVFEAQVPVASASYGGGRLVMIRGVGVGSGAFLIDAQGRSIRLDLLADGDPVSAVLSPDGTSIVFSTDAGEEAVVYTLALGSQGPAAPFPLGIDGPVTRLDTDGSWVSGLVDDRSFLLDTGTREVFVGPQNVRFTFDRHDRSYLGSGVEPIAEGRFFGWIRSATAGSIQFDDADYLTGEDAAEAAEAAGDESPPPNDIYIRNPSEETRRIPLADDVEIRVQASYPEAGVDWEAISREQWLRLLSGDTSAVEFQWYGQGTLPYWVTVANGEAVLAEEVYLP